MIHLDIKKLRRFIRTGHRITGDRTGQSNTRGVGWEDLHVCIDSAACSRRGSTCKVSKGHSGPLGQEESGNPPLGRLGDHFGYKNHIAIDNQHKLIRAYEVTLTEPLNMSLAL